MSEGRGGLRAEDLLVILPLKTQAAHGQVGSGSELAVAGWASAEEGPQGPPYCLAVVDRVERRKGEREQAARGRRQVLHCRICVTGGLTWAVVGWHIAPLRAVGCGGLETCSTAGGGLGAP